MNVEVTSARVLGPNGEPVALIDLVEVGGGSQIVTVDGQAEERVHPSSSVFHVRLIAPSRMMSDELREVATFAEAEKVAMRYAEKVAANAAKLAAIAEDLKS